MPGDEVDVEAIGGRFELHKSEEFRESCSGYVGTMTRRKAEEIARTEEKRVSFCRECFSEVWPRPEEERGEYTQVGEPIAESEEGERYRSLTLGNSPEVMEDEY